MTNETSTTTPTTNLYPGIKEIADAYRQNDFDVFASIAGGKLPYPLHIIRFRGDDPNEGHRAATLAQQLDLPLVCLRRVWYYATDDQHRPYWELTFTPSSNRCR